MRKILITNDDGIDAPGIIRLAKAAVRFGEVYVVAPESQRSAASHSITLRHSITAYPYDFPVDNVKAYAISGTPADCVRIGVLNIVPGKPDVVLSGINNGYNVATDLQYSATVGAALEACFQEIPAIAFSEDFNQNQEIIDEYLDKILEEYIDKPLMRDGIWNVNFPGCQNSMCKGILRDRIPSKSQIYKDHYNETKLPDGGISYMVEGDYHEDAEPGTDLRAIFENYISIGKVRNIG